MKSIRYVFLCKIDKHNQFNRLCIFMHQSRLRLPLLEFDTIPETGSSKRWRQQTPAMAAGLTDHVWSLREVLMFRVPPWPQRQMG
jgi:hypothetical protein